MAGAGAVLPPVDNLAIQPYRLLLVGGFFLITTARRKPILDPLRRYIMRIKFLFLSGLTSVLSLFILLLIFQISLAGAEASQRANSNAGWKDQFDSPTLDSRWEWVREDPTHWSLTDNSGSLRITTQEGSLWMGGTGKNILLTPPNMEDFQITTKVTFSPSENFQTASVAVYQDDDNYIELGRRYGDQDMIIFRFENGEIYSGWGITETATTVFLRLIKFGDVYAELLQH